MQLPPLFIEIIHPANSVLHLPEAAGQTRSAAGGEGGR